jgi:hypothetical protein
LAGQSGVPDLNQLNILAPAFSLTRLLACSEIDLRDRNGNLFEENHEEPGLHAISPSLRRRKTIF